MKFGGVRVRVRVRVTVRVKDTVRVTVRDTSLRLRLVFEVWGVTVRVRV